MTLALIELSKYKSYRFVCLLKTNSLNKLLHILYARAALLYNLVLFAYIYLQLAYTSSLLSLDLDINIIYNLCYNYTLL